MTKSPIVLSFITLVAVVSACTKEQLPTPDLQQDAESVPQTPDAQTYDAIYETWSPANVHFFHQGLGFELGDHESQKYLEWNHSWLAPEWISPEIARDNDMMWAQNRYVRWLSGTTATFAFPFYPEDIKDDVTLRMILRPKVNDAVTVKFYKTDDKENVAWTTPKTIKLKPGWNVASVTIPKDWLNQSGDQLMRLTFPGSYFEGDQRVSAKFVRIELNTSQDKSNDDALETKHTLKTGLCRIEDDARQAWIAASGDAVERYFVVPDNAALDFSVAPSPWLTAPANLSIVAYTDEDEPKIIYNKTIAPGDSWMEERLPLDEYAQKAVRLTMKFNDAEEQLFQGLNIPQDAICISAPQIMIKQDKALLAAAQNIQENTTRVVVVGIDNLRADRVLSPQFANVAPNIHALLEHAISGRAMTESLFASSSVATLLTGVALPKHGVSDDTAHIKTSLQTLAETHTDWNSYFYTTSNTIEPSRGFAQGFTASRRLNKEKLGSPQLALTTLASDIQTTPQNTFIYIQLGSLRLPLKPSSQNFDRFKEVGYDGPVNEQAMQNVAVLKDPTTKDKKQFAAYYDASLADLDQALADFIQKLPPNTLLMIYGTHGSSLGESTLGYQQTLAPWENVVPWVLYHNVLENPVNIQNVVSMTDLHHTLNGILSKNIESTPSIFTSHPSNPVSYGNGVAATATQYYFYRIRREGMDSIFDWGTNLESLQTQERTKYAVSRRALREQLNQ